MNLTQLEYDLKILKNHLGILQECLKNINDSIQNIDSFENPDALTTLLSEVKSNLDSSREIIDYIEKTKNECSNPENANLSDEDINNYYERMTTISNNFNDFLVKYIKSTSFSIDNKIQNTEKPIEDSSNIIVPPLNTIIPQNTFKLDGIKPDNISLETPAEPKINKKFVKKLKPVEDASKDEKEEKKEEVKPSEDLKNSEDNNVLIISEIKNKIFLPYKMKELKDILSTSTRYKSIQEIIDKKYTLPLGKYKNGVISRFKETYNFMKKRERASIADSLDLAMELAFNNRLNPAIILACQNLEQLDTYLDCLELDELDKFDYFEIKYEYLPIKKFMKN